MEVENDGEAGTKADAQVGGFLGQESELVNQQMEGGREGGWWEAGAVQQVWRDWI